MSWVGWLTDLFLNDLLTLGQDVSFKGSDTCFFW